MRRHWYYISTIYCPICASTEVFRERRYGRRPKRWQNRHERTEAYDYCNAL